MGIIDSHSDSSLYDVLNGDLELPDDPVNEGSGAVEFYGFFIQPQSGSGGTYHVQYDGHAGSVGTIHSEDYDDVLELVDDLMSFVFRAQEYDYQDDKESLVEWAGKIMTGDEQRAKEDPDLYLHIPDDA